MDMQRTASISADGLYRYDLSRTWGDPRTRLVFCMLNPSTADGLTDDNTIRKCIGYAQRLGCGALDVVNLFAWRSTSPSVLKSVADPIGPDNDAGIRIICRNAFVVCAWGIHGSIRGRDAQVLNILHDVGARTYALKVNESGSPAHPLYLALNRQPMPFGVTAARSI